jgi:hypothetical protein
MQDHEMIRLEGKKTYIVGAVMILLAIAKGQGWITADTYTEVTGILVGMGLWTLRAGISKAQ